MFWLTGTVLCAACACGDVEIAEMLLKNGASVNHSSQHSSPLIYACEINNVELAKLLLNHGAVSTVVPKGLKTNAPYLPLYQACMKGHKETAELLFLSCNQEISLDKKIGFLGLLGAQCININSDFEAGVRFWKQALSEVEELCAKYPDTELVNQLKRMYLKDDQDASNANVSSGLQVHAHSGAILKDVKLCFTVEELERIENNEESLTFQALLVLENILGCSHTETIKQISQTARSALEKGDFCKAAKLFFYVIESSENQKVTYTSPVYTGQFMDLLLNYYVKCPEVVKNIQDLSDILIGMLNFVQEGSHKLCEQMVAGDLAVNNSDNVEHQLYDNVETVLALIRILVTMDLTPDQVKRSSNTVMQFLKLKNHRVAGRINVEWELMRLAVYGTGASFTLYAFHEDLFPNMAVLNLLLRSGINVNCLNSQDDTPLHLALECDKPRSDIVTFLLDSGAHIDVANKKGTTPYSLLQVVPRCQLLGILPFQYMTLKCLAAQAIVESEVSFMGHIPKDLELFVPLHKSPCHGRQNFVRAFLSKK